jgi:hypothetical protein
MDIDDVPKVGELVYIYWNLDDVVIIKARGYGIYSLIENVNLGG